jgi:hypothetical protein
MAISYELDGRVVGVRVPVGEDFSAVHVAQTGSGAHPAYFATGTGRYFPWGKVATH